MLGGAGLLDIAHAAMDLHAERGDLVADIGRKRLGDRRQQRRALARLAPLAPSSPMQRAIDRDGGQMADAARRMGQRLHRQQHALDVGMFDDRAHRRRRRWARVPGAGRAHRRRPAAGRDRRCRRPACRPRAARCSSSRTSRRGRGFPRRPASRRRRRRRHRSSRRSARRECRACARCWRSARRCARPARRRA